MSTIDKTIDPCIDPLVTHPNAWIAWVRRPQQGATFELVWQSLLMQRGAGQGAQLTHQAQDTGHTHHVQDPPRWGAVWENNMNQHHFTTEDTMHTDHSNIFYKVWRTSHVLR